MRLNDLVGTRTLDARGEYIGHDDYTEDCRVVLLRIDSTFYAFRENPSDGYRSMCEEPREATPEDIEQATIAEFPPIVCEFRMRTEGDYNQTDDVLYAVNEQTGLVILEIGTENTDDYYPYFVTVWRPDGYELKPPAKWSDQ